MRQKSFLYSLMTLLTVSLSLSLGNQAHSNNIQSGDNPVIIIIRPSGSSSDTRPRMPSSTRIEAYYSPDTSTVYCWRICISHIVQSGYRRDIHI